jgi:hypothetical protein
MPRMTAQGPAGRVFSDLTPTSVLDALQAVGFHGDGRVLQLNSYENRVVQVFLEDGSAVVAKFYRPGRWSNAQIIEEHLFAAELAAAEVPVVPPLVLAASNEPGPATMALSLMGEPPTLAVSADPHWPGAGARKPQRLAPVGPLFGPPACRG